MSNFKIYMHKYWRGFSTAVFFVFLEALCDLMQPTIMSKIVDIGVKNKDLNYVLHMSCFMLLVTGFGAIAASIRNIVSSTVSQKFGTQLRKDLFEKIQSFSFESMNKYDDALLIIRLTNDVTQLQNFVNGLMRIFIKAPMVGIGSIIMAAKLNLRLSIILFSIIPIVTFLIYLNMKIGYPYFTKVQKLLDSVNSIMREYLSGIRVVKAFNRFDYEVDKFGDKNSQYTEISTAANKITSIFFLQSAWLSIWA